MSKRGDGSSNNYNKGTEEATEQDGRNLASELHGSSKDKSEMKSFLRSDIKNDKEGNPDTDVSYWLIDKDGEQYFYHPGNDDWDSLNVKRSELVYIGRQHADGYDDSNGLQSGNDEHSKIMSSNDAYEGYMEAVEERYVAKGRYKIQNGRIIRK